MARKLKPSTPSSDEKVYGLIAYLSVLCIIPLVFRRDNEFVLFHAKQGLVLFLLQVLFFIFHIILGDWILRWGLFLCGIAAFFWYCECS